MKSYCTQNGGDCGTCALVNYNRDCRNNRVEPDFEQDFEELMDEIEAGDRAEAERRLDVCCSRISQLPPDIRASLASVLQRPLTEVRKEGFGALSEELKAIFDNAGVEPPWED